MTGKIPNLLAPTWSAGPDSEWIESLRTRAKARRDEMYSFITHIPVTIGMSTRP